MAPRVSSSERVRAEIDAPFSSDRKLATVLDEASRLTVRLLMQQAVEVQLARSYDRVLPDDGPGRRVEGDSTSTVGGRPDRHRAAGEVEVGAVERGRNDCRSTPAVLGSLPRNGNGRLPDRPAKRSLRRRA